MENIREEFSICNTYGSSLMKAEKTILTGKGLVNINSLLTVYKRPIKCPLSVSVEDL